MNTNMLKLKSPWVFFWALMIFQSAAAQQSGFNLNDEGWTVEGDAQGSSIIPYYDSTGGNPGGYCYANDDVLGNYWYWSAPDTFLGNKSASFGKYLRFDLKQNALTSQENTADVILEGNGVKIYYNTPYNPDIDWTHYDVLLDTVNWEKNYYGSGQFVSRDGLIQILSSLTKLWIRGEYRTGPDIGSIDNVILEPLFSAVSSLYKTPTRLDIFPNPCFSSITIQLKTPDPSITTIEITNTLGQSVYEAPIWNGSTIIIDVAEFLPGIYFVVVKSKGQLVTQKIVKR